MRGFVSRHILLLSVVTAVLLAIGGLSTLSLSYEPNSVRVDVDDVVTQTCCRDSRADYDRPTLRVAIAAMISPETTKQYFGELMREIGRRMGRRTVFLQRKTYAEVNDLLEQKEVDVAFVCSGPYIDGKERFGMEILAVPVVNGRSFYRSLTLVHKDSEFQSFDDLKGKRFAFTDPDSNTGHLVPRYILAERGTTPEKFFGETFFTNSHDNSIGAVATGLADGASVDSLVWQFLKAAKADIAEQTRVIYESPEYGIPPIVVHPSLSGEIKQQLKEIFLALNEDPEVLALMQKLRIERFDTGRDTDYDSVRDMRIWVRKMNDIGL